MVSGDDLVLRPKSAAGLKLSGCKNVTPAVRSGERSVWLPKWGVTLCVDGEVPEDVSSCGVRARFVERAEGPGENCFRMRVDRVSDSRFERMLLLGFVDRDGRDAPTVEACEDEMRYLHQHLFWCLPMLDGLTFSVAGLPERGDEVWVRIPPERVHLVV